MFFMKLTWKGRIRNIVILSYLIQRTQNLEYFSSSSSIVITIIMIYDIVTIFIIMLIIFIVIYRLFSFLAINLNDLKPHP